jgi:hypothetical protein
MYRMNIIKYHESNPRIVGGFVGFGYEGISPQLECTIKKWLDFMGDTSNGHTPFKINFNITTDEPWFDPKTNMTYTPRFGFISFEEITIRFVTCLITVQIEKIVIAGRTTLEELLW